MPTPPLSPALASEAFAAVERTGSQVAAAAELGISRSTLQGRLRTYNARKEHTQEKAFDFPFIPSSELPIEDLVERMTTEYQRRAIAARARECITIKAKSDEPFALVWFGDPHIDDDGCDWPSLRRDIDTVRSTEGMFACNIGDTTNNWVGRLAAIYAHQHTTKKDGIRLTEWLFETIPWFCVILGNHDMWSGDDSPINFLKNNCGVVSDWAARFRIEFPNGQRFDVDARHDHPGASQDNPLQGQMRAKIRSAQAQDADLIIGGHRHTWGIAANEDIRRNRVTHYLRARGYKMDDHYAVVNGFNQQRLGQSVVTVIDPRAERPGQLCTSFIDVQEAAEFLSFKRSRRKPH